MELTKLTDIIIAYEKHLKLKTAALISLLNQIKDSIKLIHEKAQLSREIVQKFPDLKIRVTNNIHSLIDDEINLVCRSLNILNEEIAPLNKMNRKLELFAMSVEWNHFKEFLTAFTEIAEWMEKTYKYFLNVGSKIRHAIRQCSEDKLHSAKWFENLEDINQKSIRYVFYNPVTMMIPLFLKDIQTRNKSIVKNITC